MKTLMLSVIFAASGLAHAGGSDVGSAGGDSSFTNMFIPLATCKISKESEAAVTSSKSNRSSQFTLIADLGQMAQEKPIQAIIVNSDSQVGALSDKNARVLKTGVGSAVSGLLAGFSLKTPAKSAVFESSMVLYNDIVQWKDVITFKANEGQIISAEWNSIMKDGSSNGIAKFHCE